MTVATNDLSTVRPAPRIGSTAPKGGALGLLPDLSRDPLGFMTRLTREYGDFVPIRLGLTPAVVIGHPDLVEEVFVTRNHDYRKATATRRLGSLLGNGLLLSEGDFWLRQRRLMQPAFHRQHLGAMARTMIDTAARLLETWDDGQTRTINQEMTEVTLGIVARTLFGTDVREDLATIRNASLVANAHFHSRLFSLLTLLPDSFPTPGNLRYQRAVHDLHRLVDRIVNERRRRDGDDLLSMLLSVRKEGGMSRQQLRDEVLTLLLAGHDTTALALTWAWVLLAQHPEVESRLHAEIDSVMGSDGPPSPRDVPRLSYADHVVTETLRVRPTAWAIGREALRDTEICGQRVRRGTSVLLSPWVLHHDPRFFDDPETFRPERWSDGLAERLPRFAYLPFGGGQRVCIGASFAQLEATLVLTTIAQSYRLELVDPSQPVAPWPVVALRTRGDVAMRLIRRRTDHPA